MFIEANNSLTINHTQANQVIYCNVFVVQVIMYSMCEDYVLGTVEWMGSDFQVMRRCHCVGWVVGSLLVLDLLDGSGISR